jgi:Na+-translocating ferredoxin:NAD+ oxidoreductase RNF subunit RnfB
MNETSLKAPTAERLKKWLPVIDADLCTGCGACVRACGPACLKIDDNNIAVLFMPDHCGSEEHCIAPCPEKCIHMEWVESEGDPARGKWRA